ncbi:MAG: GNAT family N-acetyltransferase [Symploca sp. SIO2C1]|nr:GNAT family N-acetyltransferase [Symploca sp. SIO2C1]
MLATLHQSATGSHHFRCDGKLLWINRSSDPEIAIADFLSKHPSSVIVREDYNPNQPRDARGRWKGGGGGRRGGGRRGGKRGLAAKKVSELQDIARKEGIDVNTLSHKSRKSVLTAAIKAKRRGQDLREKGLLKPTKVSSLRRKPKKTTPKKPKRSKENPELTPSVTWNLDKRQLKEWNKAYQHITNSDELNLYQRMVDTGSTRYKNTKKELDLIKKSSPEELRQLGYKKGKKELIEERSQLANSLKKRLDEDKKVLADFNKNNPVPKEYRNLPDDKVERARSARWIFDEIKAANDSKIAITDAKGNLQAAASFSKSKDNIHIDYLASAPWNIAGSDSRSTRGAGTKAIVEAVKISKEAGYKGKLTLNPLQDAVPFYEKLGFTEGWSGMTLSPSAAETLLKKVENK